MRTRGSGTLSLNCAKLMRTCITVCCTAVARSKPALLCPALTGSTRGGTVHRGQQAGATWNRAAVSLNPRSGDGLEVHASYLGMADGQTTRESFLLEGTAVEAKPVATAEAAEATVQSVDSVEAEREAIERELESLLRSQVANEVEAAVESAEEPLLKLLKSLPLRAWLLLQVLLRPVTAVASAQEKEDVEEAVEASTQPAQAEFAPVEAEFEHD